MITKYKIFENNKNEPQVGDFVIVDLIYFHSIKININRKNADQFEKFESKTLKKKSGDPWTCKKNGVMKTWKTRPNEFKIPVKIGMYNHFYIDQNNCDAWCGILDLDKNASEFFKKNITKITKITKDGYFFVNYKNSIIQDIQKDEIKYFSKDKSDLEAILQGEKFGL